MLVLSGDDSTKTPTVSVSYLYSVSDLVIRLLEVKFRPDVQVLESETWLRVRWPITSGNKLKVNYAWKIEQKRQLCRTHLSFHYPAFIWPDINVCSNLGKCNLTRYDSFIRRFIICFWVSSSVSQHCWCVDISRGWGICTDFWTVKICIRHLWFTSFQGLSVWQICSLGQWKVNTWRLVFRPVVILSELSTNRKIQSPDLPRQHSTENFCVGRTTMFSENP